MINANYMRTGLKTPRLTKRYVQKFSEEFPDQIPEKDPENYKRSDFFNGMFSEELSKIPQEHHGRVADYAHKYVDARVREYMVDVRFDIEQQLKQ